MPLGGEIVCGCPSPLRLLGHTAGELDYRVRFIRAGDVFFPLLT